MSGKKMALSIVIGSALKPGYKRTFQTATGTAAKLGAALDKTGHQQTSINQFKALKKSVGSISGEMKGAQLKTAALAKQIKATHKPSKKLIHDFTQAKQQSARLKDSYRHQSEQLHKLRSGLHRAGIDTLKLGRAERVLGHSLDATRHKMDRLHRAQAAKSRLGSFKGGAIGALGLAYGAGRIFGAEADIEQRYTRLGIQANITKDRVDALRQKILDTSLAPDIKVKPEKILSAIEAIIEKTGDLPFAEANIRAIGIAISATGASGGAIGELTAELEKMHTFKGPGAVLKALDTLNVQGKSGAFTLQNLAALGPRVITAYNSVVKGGRSGATTLREMGAALQVIRMGTGSSEQAATAFEGVLRTLQDAKKIEKINNLGVQVFDPNQPGAEILRPINQIMLDLIQATGGKKTILGKIFDAEGIRAFNALIQDPSIMQKFIRVQGDGVVTLKDSRRAADEVSQSMGALATSVIQIGAAITGTFSPVLKPVFDRLSLWAKATTDVIRENKSLGLVIGGVVAAFVTVTSVLVAVTAAQWAWNTSLVTSFASNARATAGFIVSKAAILGSALATGTATAAQWLWNAAMTANPIGLVIAGVAALSAGAFFLYKNWNSVTKWFGKKLNWLADKFSFVGDTWHSIFGGDKKTSITHRVKQTFDTIKAPVFSKAAPAALAASLALAPTAQALAPTAQAAGPVINNGAINITVHASPGMDERALAGQVRDQVDQAMTDSLHRYNAERRGRLYD